MKEVKHVDFLFFLRCIETALAILAMTLVNNAIHKPTGWRITISVLIIITSCLLMTAIYQKLGVAAAEKIYTPIIFIIIGGLIFYHSTDKFWVTFSNFLTQCIIYFGVSIGCGTVNYFLFEANVTIYLLMRAVVFGLLIFIQFRYTRQPFRNLVNTISSEWYLISLLLFVFAILIIMLSVYPTMYYDRSVHEQIELLIAYVLFLIGIRCLFVAMHHLAQKQKLLKSELEMKEKVKFMETYKRLSETDPLTGLLNRRAFEEQVKAGLVPNETAILLFMDIDDFKVINDTYGHGVGDEALKLLGEVLQHSFRNTDIIARIGGDEFIVLMKNMQKDDEKIQQIITAFHLNLHQTIAARPTIPAFTVSVGVAAMTDQDDLSKIYKKADQAMYVTKKMRPVATER